MNHGGTEDTETLGIQGRPMAAGIPCFTEHSRTDLSFPKNLRVLRASVVNKTVAALASFLLVTALVACRRGMVDQPRLKPLAQSDFFANGSASRPIPAHTIARGHLDENDAFFTGKIDGKLVTDFPTPVTRDLLARGRERFEIHCAVCHAATGDGDGMIVQRGFPRPPSLHEQRLRDAPVGHFFDVITNGYGVMFSYAARVEPVDRWAIAAYVRALQLSRQATPDDVPPEERAKLGTMARPATVKVEFNHGGTENTEGF